MSIPALGPTEPPIQWYQGSVPRDEVAGGEAHHSPPYSSKVKNAWSYTSNSPYIFMAWCLIKHRDNFTEMYKVIMKSFTST